MHDVIVVGGGPAGLQAALTLGRMHRTCLVLDAGRYRNDPAAELHNFIDHDGQAPGELRRTAHEDVSRYDTVEVLDVEVSSVVAVGDAFEVTTSDGVHPARRVILATGLRDVLPAVPGMDELWGTVVAHCPFCHGHELSGGTVALQGGPHAPRVAALLSRIAGRLVVLADGYALTDAELGQLDRIGAEVREGGVLALRADGDGAVVDLDDGSELRVDGYFAAGALEQAAPFAATLGSTCCPAAASRWTPSGAPACRACTPLVTLLTRLPTRCRWPPC